MRVEPDTAGPSPGSDVPWDMNRIRAQLKRWQVRLLDLSKVNPLLRINRSRVSRLRVAEPSAEAVFRDLVVAGGSLRMPRVVKAGGAEEGRIRDLPCGGMRIFVEIELRRVACRRCGAVKRERLDFLADNPRYTKRVAFYVGRRYHAASIQDIAEGLHLE